MHKTKIAVVALGALFLAGCSGQNDTPKEAEKKPDPGYLQGMVDIDKKAQSDIQNATDAENKKINNALDESGLNDNKNNMDYAKQYTGAVLKTSLGDIKIKFYNDATPVTVNNFLKLSSEKFYEGVKFHRVIKGFMIQGGDPNSKTADVSTWGMGGPGYTIPAEIKLKNTRGTIATARLGDQVNPKKESSGSQFYINTVNNTSLDGGYTVFGEVTEGMDVVDKIENVKTVSPGQIDRPVEDVVIQSVELVK